MASFLIHLAIGKRYIEKSNNIKDKNHFYKGIVAPDLVEDKKISHYTKRYDKTNLIECLANKVQLYEYLVNNDINSDYEKGVFIHLITDYLFYNKFFDINFLKNISFGDFFNNLYYSYDITDEYLKDKYKIDCTDILQQIEVYKNDKRANNNIDEVKTNILPQSKLNDFIEYVSNISLEDYKNKIIHVHKNVIP